MRAVMAIQEGVVGVREIPLPRPGEFEALVRMDACAICNSTDHKFIANEFHPGSFPVVLGHEVISTVVEVGPKVKSFAVGDRVFRQRLADHHVPGGRSCWGGMAEFGLVTDAWAAKGLAYGPDALPHDQQKLLIDLEPALATAMVTLMETLDCIATSGARPGVSVAVVGSGPVGQALAMFAKLLGASPVWAFGRHARHAERFARVCHADGYATGDDWPAPLAKIVAAGGFDLVVEAVGQADALDLCIRLAGGKGKVGVYGIAPESSPYRQEQMSRPNVARLGAKEGRAQARLAQWVQSGQVRLEDWVSHRLPMSDCQKAFDMVSRKEAMKAVLLP